MRFPENAVNLYMSVRALVENLWPEAKQGYAKCVTVLTMYEQFESKRESGGQRGDIMTA